MDFDVLAFVRLSPSPLLPAALLLAIAVSPLRAAETPGQRDRAEDAWTRFRWWTFVPWSALVVLALIAWLLHPIFAPELSSGTWWYALPAVAFAASFLHYFYLERHVGGSTTPEFARRFNRFVFSNCVLAATCTSFFLAGTGEFLREGIIVLIAMVPATFVTALGVMLFLLLDGHSVASSHVGASAAEAAPARPHEQQVAFVDRFFHSKRLTGALFVCGHLLRSLGIGSIHYSLVQRTHVVATLLSFAVFGTVCAGWARRNRRKVGHARYPTFVLALAGLAAFNILRELSSVGWFLVSTAGH
ncbi:MAG TPA: hypothetical protein VK509_09430 [Polyangiales bacterium]|nr:hypothetical protein [Polyangiales bacterium]